jgi:hypothetical protein
MQAAQVEMKWPKDNISLRAFNGGTIAVPSPPCAPRMDEDAPRSRAVDAWAPCDGCSQGQRRTMGMLTQGRWLGR